MYYAMPFGPWNIGVCLLFPNAYIFFLEEEDE